jgi:hypothetical protein
MKKNHAKEQLFKRVAYLEFVEDQLRTELSYLDKLLRAVGFPQGLISVKEVAKEMLKDHSKD